MNLYLLGVSNEHTFLLLPYGQIIPAIPWVSEMDFLSKGHTVF